MTAIRTEALALLKSPHFFQRVLQAVRNAGLVGEEQNALVVFLVAVSRLLAKPLCLFIKGHSATGKNFLAQTVLRLIPSTHIFEITSATENAWSYQGKKLMHKVLYDQEMDQSSGSVRPSRLLISEDRLIRWITVRKNGKPVTKKVVTKGPVAPISTSTSNRLKIDDESRRISVWMDESPEQTSRIMDAQLELSAGLNDKDLALWREVQCLLAERAALPVRFPGWFKELNKYIGKSDVTLRRYYPAFLEAVKLVCRVNSFRRYPPDGVKLADLQVGFVDFAMTAIIFERAFSKSLAAREDDEMEIRGVVERVYVKTGRRPVSARDVARELRISRDRAYARLRKAANHGTIKRANRPERTNLKLYVPVPESRFLPDPAEVFQKVVCGGWRVRFVHPISGERVTYFRFD
jgi:CTP-dependent riboflavin kinase